MRDGSGRVLFGSSTLERSVRKLPLYLKKWLWILLGCVRRWRVCTVGLAILIVLLQFEFRYLRLSEFFCQTIDPDIRAQGRGAIRVFSIK